MSNRFNEYIDEMLAACKRNEKKYLKRGTGMTVSTFNIFRYTASTLGLRNWFVNQGGRQQPIFRLFFVKIFIKHLSCANFY